MQIENLSKELDKETMTTVSGGASTGQVVPTVLQNNDLKQIFNVASNGPVAIANDGSADNDADVHTFNPVDSLVASPGLLREIIK